MNSSLINNKHTRDSYPELEYVLENTINYLSYFSSPYPTETICEKPEPHLEKSSIRSVIHTLIFNHRIANYKGDFYARSFFIISEKDAMGNPVKPPRYIKENCGHGLNCPVLIGTCLFIWISKKYEFFLPPRYEDFGGCRFFHDRQDIGIVFKKVGDIMEKIYEKHSSIKQEDQQPIYRAMYNTYFFASKHNEKKYPVKKIRVFKFTNLTAEEAKDLKKRSKDIDIPVFTDDIFFVSDMPISPEDTKKYIETQEKKINENYCFKNLSSNPYNFYIRQDIPDVNCMSTFPRFQEKTQEIRKANNNDDDDDSDTEEIEEKDEF